MKWRHEMLSPVVKHKSSTSGSIGMKQFLSRTRLRPFSNNGWHKCKCKCRLSILFTIRARAENMKSLSLAFWVPCFRGQWKAPLILGTHEWAQNIAMLALRPSRSLLMKKDSAPTPGFRSHSITDRYFMIWKRGVWLLKVPKLQLAVVYIVSAFWNFSKMAKFENSSTLGARRMGTAHAPAKRKRSAESSPLQLYVSTCFLAQRQRWRPQ